MSDYLTNLLVRTWHPERTIQPRASSIFDSASAISIGRGTEGGGTGEVREEGFDDIGLDPSHDRAERQVPRAPIADQGTIQPSLQQPARFREQEVASTVGDDRLSPSSELEVNGLDREETIRVNDVVPDSRHIEERRPGSDEPPAKFSVKATGLKQKRTFPLSTRAGPSEVSVMEGSTDRANTGAGGESLRFNRGRLTEQSEVSPMVTAFQSHDHESTSPVTVLGAGVGTLLFHDSDGPTQSGDRNGEPLLQHRQVTAARRSEATASDSQKEPITLDLSEVSLDSSLVAPVSVKKPAVLSQHNELDRSADLPDRSVAAAEEQTPFGHAPAVPMTAKSVIATRRSVVPSNESRVSREPARDRERSAEPVVQVTIGRVEVRAVAPPVRQERGRKAPSAMSLDDYLKRRGGRSGG